MESEDCRQMSRRRERRREGERGRGEKNEEELKSVQHPFNFLFLS
jgi:hypothetical protein